MVTAALQRTRIKPTKPLLMKKSTVRSKPFKAASLPKVKKETK